MFKNDVLNIKIKKNTSQIPIQIQAPTSSHNNNLGSVGDNNLSKPEINFNSTINNYTSVYTVISNREK
jgi:hypothetical protein